MDMQISSYLLFHENDGDDRGRARPRDDGARAHDGRGGAHGHDHAHDANGHPHVRDVHHDERDLHDADARALSLLPTALRLRHYPPISPHARSFATSDLPMQQQSLQAVEAQMIVRYVFSLFILNIILYNLIR